MADDLLDILEKGEKEEGEASAQNGDEQSQSGGGDNYQDDDKDANQDGNQDDASDEGDGADNESGNSDEGEDSNGDANQDEGSGDDTDDKSGSSDAPLSADEVRAEYLKELGVGSEQELKQVKIWLDGLALPTASAISAQQEVS